MYDDKTLIKVGKVYKGICVLKSELYNRLTDRKQQDS